jgi:hypothetical protein
MFRNGFETTSSGLKKSHQHATICVSIRQLQGKGRNNGQNDPGSGHQS